MAETGKQGGSERITETVSGESPVRADLPSHRLNGKFAPGNAAGGRKPKAVEKAYLDAVRDALPPEQIASLLTEALNLARETRSWRGMAEVISIALAYGAGKPTQKTITSDGNLDVLLAALADDAPLLPAGIVAPGDVAGQGPGENVRDV